MSADAVIGLVMIAAAAAMLAAFWWADRRVAREVSRGLAYVDRAQIDAYAARLHLLAAAIVADMQAARDWDAHVAGVPGVIDISTQAADLYDAVTPADIDWKDAR